MNAVHNDGFTCKASPGDGDFNLRKDKFEHGIQLESYSRSKRYRSHAQEAPNKMSYSGSYGVYIPANRTNNFSLRRLARSTVRIGGDSCKSHLVREMEVDEVC